MSNHFPQTLPIWVKRQTILDRRIWVYYLIILERAADHLRELIEVEPDKRFFKVLGRHVEKYLESGQMPPEAIAPVVMNIADDYLAGRDVVLRAGDYIQLQNFVRKEG